MQQMLQLPTPRSPQIPPARVLTNQWNTPVAILCYPINIPLVFVAIDLVASISKLSPMPTGPQTRTENAIADLGYWSVLAPLGMVELMLLRLNEPGPAIQATPWITGN